MRLINTRTLELHEFFSENVPPYAILSHAWGDQEVTFQDWKDRQQAASKKGFSKIQRACYQALCQKLEWLWVDTNCIDKSSSAELTEAINSMFAYYQKSQVCFAYLVDVPTANENKTLLYSQIQNSRWFTRGWTLQELIAPRDVVFYAADWSRIGSKDKSLARLITSITSIDMIYLNGRKNILLASIAKRMSWLAKRTTTRTEDMAYCMLGIFDINMPLLYGEGKRAFFRLQKEIIKGSNDHTIFCWEWTGDVPGDWASLLAPWPTVFKGSGEFERLSSDEISLFSMTNAGLSIRLPVIKTLNDSARLAGSWFVMLQAAPSDTILDHPEAACIRVGGDEVGDRLYVSRSSYPPRPMTISKDCAGNFKREDLLVMNKLANAGVFKATETLQYDKEPFSFIPLFGSSSFKQEWEFRDTFGGDATTRLLRGAVTLRIDREVGVAAVLTTKRVEEGSYRGSDPYILLGLKRTDDSCHASGKIVAARHGSSTLEPHEIEKTLRHWKQRVTEGKSATPGGYHNEKLGITMVLERSRDVIRKTRNCYFLCLYKGDFSCSPSAKSKVGSRERVTSGDESDVASDVAESGGVFWY